MRARIKLRSGRAGYRVSYRDVRYPRLELKTGSLLVVMPKSSKMEPEEIVAKHRRWIDDRRKVIAEALAAARRKSLDTRRSEAEFRDIVREEVGRAAGSLGCRVGKLFFRRLNSKWASCSSSGNLTFNRYMRFLPQNLIGYVVYHELAHINNRKHDSRFWRVLHKEYADSNLRERELLSYWLILQRAMRRDRQMLQ